MCQALCQVLSIYFLMQSSQWTRSRHYFWLHSIDNKMRFGEIEWTTAFIIMQVMKMEWIQACSRRFPPYQPYSVQSWWKMSWLEEKFIIIHLNPGNPYWQARGEGQLKLEAERLTVWLPQLAHIKWGDVTSSHPQFSPRHLSEISKSEHIYYTDQSIPWNICVRWVFVKWMNIPLGSPTHKRNLLRRWMSRDTTFRN